MNPLPNLAHTTVETLRNRRHEGRLGRRRLGATMAGFLVIAGALGAPAASAADVTVFAASSLTGSLDEVATAYQTATGTHVTISYGGSSALAQQIEQGAPADIYISADIAWMDYLAGKNLIKADTRTDILGNTLVLVEPAGSAFDAGSDLGAAIVAALGTDGHIAMANVDSVPAGRYGKAALTTLGVWDAVEPHVAQADNVRAALAFVTTAEAPLGIVYATDALAEPGVAVAATFPDASHDPIVYPAAIVASSTNADAAGFFTYLTGTDAAATFQAHGFLPPPAE